MLAGGVALALGLYPRLAAGALAGSLVPTTLAVVAVPLAQLRRRGDLLEPLVEAGLVLGKPVSPLRTGRSRHG
jgi:uncharacterized membrane protein YphA (DoxX/SURF4 family)